MVLSRMDLADIGNPDELAKAIVRMWPDMPIPVPIERIAAELDVSDIAELTTDGFVGALATDAARSVGAIFVAKGIHRVRRRFTIGHELGHFLCPWHKPRHNDRFLCTTADMRRASVSKSDPAIKMEVEANRFAANLLLPERPFRQSMRQRKGVDIEHILSLVSEYDMSKEATARRYVELHDEPCGAVVSQNGQVLRFYRNKDFPWIEPSKKGSSIPTQSLSATTEHVVGRVSDMREVSGTVWFPSGPGQKPPKTFEQILPQQDGFVLTLLTVETPDDEEEDERDLEASWTPRFRR